MSTTPQCPSSEPTGTRDLPTPEVSDIPLSYEHVIARARPVTWVLDDQAWEKFLEVLHRPARVKPKLAALFEEPPIFHPAIIEEDRDWDRTAADGID